MKKTLQECKEIVAKERDVIHKHFWNEELTDLANKMYYEQSEWIRVEDRLPELESEYLCGTYFMHTNQFTQPICKFTFYRTRATNEIILMDGITGCFVDRCNYGQVITHWMPLPSPPKQ
jgi:hypothetical protein